MDGLSILLIAFYILFKFPGDETETQPEVAEIKENKAAMVTRLNPDFYVDDSAFRRIADELVGK